MAVKIYLYPFKGVVPGQLDNRVPASPVVSTLTSGLSVPISIEEANKPDLDEKMSLLGFDAGVEVSAIPGSTRHHGTSATDPTIPAPADGDRYYNTVLKLEMQYDSTRAKWLSIESATLPFGRVGNTALGSYFRGMDGILLSSTEGYTAPRNGTIVEMGYTRTDVDAATIQVVEGGTTRASLATAAVSGSSVALDGDFTSGGVLAVRNALAGNVVSDMHGFFVVRWRA
jgi:hypothetical protein